MNEIKFSHRMGIEDSTAINDGSEEKNMKNKQGIVDGEAEEESLI